MLKQVESMKVNTARGLVAGDERGGRTSEGNGVVWQAKVRGDSRLYRRILNEILVRIDGGEFPVGGRLPPERELAERFGVSRPSIREVIIALEVLGRVEVKNGSGVYVLDCKTQNPPAYDPAISAFELTEARALIEGETAALAATMISDSQLEVLESALLGMARTDSDGAEEADRQFHAVIADATGNKMLISVVRELWAVRTNSPVVHRAYQAICETDGQKRVDEHMEILVALQNRDAPAARMAMYRHFERILNKLIASNEQLQVQEIKRQTLERRKRFSLSHLELG